MDLLDRYLDKNKIFNFEGERGVRRLEKVVSDIGNYHNIKEFLADNSGACEAIIDFVRKCIPHNPEWKDALTDILDNGIIGEE